MPVPNDESSGEEDEEFVIQKVVDSIWDEYDKDGSGNLDKEETRAFCKDSLQ